jgi:hypothetical protein
LAAEAAFPADGVGCTAGVFGGGGGALSFVFTGALDSVEEEEKRRHIMKVVDVTFDGDHKNK